MGGSSSRTAQLGQLCSPHIVELEALLTWIFLGFLPPKACIVASGSSGSEHAVSLDG